jgi:hypothetical protein
LKTSEWFGYGKVKESKFVTSSKSLLGTDFDPISIKEACRMRISSNGYAAPGNKLTARHCYFLKKLPPKRRSRFDALPSLFFSKAHFPFASHVSVNGYVWKPFSQ